MGDRAIFNLPIADLFRQLKTTDKGLSSKDAKLRLDEYGENTLTNEGKIRFLPLLVSQFNDFMILVLLAAAFISGVVGDAVDTAVILFIVLVNALMGATQSFRASKAIESLKKMATPNSMVYRDGVMRQVQALELVPGDIVEIEAGNLVAADLRLLEQDNLQTDESALTGESKPVSKDPLFLASDTIDLSEYKNMLFSGSLVTRGRGKAVVVSTGMNTELGTIATLLEESKDKTTPLQTRLKSFGQYLAIAVIVICILVFAAGLLQGQPVVLMLLTSISLAVAAIPEALPAVIAISLAFGARRLLKLNALVRNLPAVETLGSVTYICTDKTGTLTENTMTVDSCVVSGQQVDFTTVEDGPLLTVMALSNDVMQADGGILGEPTELALFEGALKKGVNKFELERQQKRLAALPFDSKRKRMSTLHQRGNAVQLLCKGATESVLACCDFSLQNGQPVALEKDKYLEFADSLAAQGYRVLAFAERSLPSLPDTLNEEELECKLTLLGLVGLIDPLRAEVKSSVEEAIEAGIVPIMITGDHPITAGAIAKQLGWLDSHAQVLEGKTLYGLSDEALQKQVKNTRVYARTSPEQKLQIVRALQQQGELVAMTGDGVNDAPALQKANIGVAMGLKGTDVARQAADMVLLDDNFATIVKAVKTGRRIFDNIRHFIKDTMSSNSGEIWTLFLAPILGLPIPLLPTHILWINLVTDGFPGLAFSAEPADKNVMKRPPRPSQQSVFAEGMWQHIVWVGLFVAFISLGAMTWALQTERQTWQTIVFTVLTLSQLFHSFAVRSDKESVFTLGLMSNKYMILAIFFAFLMQLCVIYLPWLNDVFRTQPLPIADLLVCILLSSLVLVAVEIEKLLVRAKLIYQQ